MRVLGSSDVVGPCSTDDVAGLVDRLRPLAARSEPWFVLTARADVDTARRTVSLARAGAPGSVGVVHPSTLPPLALEVLGDTLARLSSTLGAGALLVVAEALERSMVAGAALASVSRLADPTPSMGQHLRSWWPPSRFVVVTHPTPQIRVVKAGVPQQLHLPETSAGLDVVCTTGDESTHAVVDTVCVRLTGGAPGDVPPPAASRGRWASSRFTEFAAVQRDVAVLVQTALDATVECRSCGAPVAWSSCRFCHARRPDADDLVAAAAANDLISASSDADILRGDA